MARLFLAMNGKRINTLDDLRENFNAQQILAFYKSKRLHSWLEEQSCSEILENINSLEPDYDDDTLLSMLMAVFELDDEQVAKIEAEVAEEIAQEEEKAAEKKKVPEMIELPPEISDVASPEESFQDAFGIKWRDYMLPGELSDTIESSNTISARNVAWKEKPIAGTKALTIDELFFADGFFWCHICTGNIKKSKWIPALLRSTDCKSWDVLPCTQICGAIENFQKDDILITRVHDGLGPFHINSDNSVYTSGAHVLYDSAIKFWSDGNTSFYCGRFSFYFSRPGEPWHEIEKPKAAEPDAVANLGDVYLAFTANRYGKNELFLAKDDFCWQKYDMTKDCIAMCAGNGIVVFVDKKQRNYYIGKF